MHVDLEMKRGEIGRVESNSAAQGVAYSFALYDIQAVSKIIIAMWVTLLKIKTGMESLQFANA